MDHVCRVGDLLQENGNGGTGILYSNQKHSGDLLVVEEERTVLGQSFYFCNNTNQTSKRDLNKSKHSKESVQIARSQRATV